MKIEISGFVIWLELKFIGILMDEIRNGIKIRVRDEFYGFDFYGWIESSVIF